MLPITKWNIFMWFKRATFFDITTPITGSYESLSESLEPLIFSPCLPSLPASVGWVPPLSSSNGGGLLVHPGQDAWLLCLQFEEKILPATVIRDALSAKIAEIKEKEDRPVRAKEKQDLKAEITQTLLPKAFTKKTRVYGYIDLKNNALIVDSTKTTELERFVAFLKRAMPTTTIERMESKKPAAVMTNWLKHEGCPPDFELGLSCVLQDPNQFKRVIRCQHQDPLAQSIQSLLEDGCEITALSLTWKDQIQFILASDLSLRSIKFQEAVIELAKEDYTETTEQRFDTDFIIMSQILSQLIQALSHVFKKEEPVPA